MAWMLLHRKPGDAVIHIEGESMSGTSGNGWVVIDPGECTGCALCIEVCPVGCLMLSEEVGRNGYRSAVYSGDACRADGFCAYACPEPGALTFIEERHQAAR